MYRKKSKTVFTLTSLPMEKKKSNNLNWSPMSDNLKKAHLRKTISVVPTINNNNNYFLTPEKNFEEDNNQNFLLLEENIHLKGLIEQYKQEIDFKNETIGTLEENLETMKAMKEKVNDLNFDNLTPKEIPDFSNEKDEIDFLRQENKRLEKISKYKNNNKEKEEKGEKGENKTIINILVKKIDMLQSKINQLEIDKNEAIKNKENELSIIRLGFSKLEEDLSKYKQKRMEDQVLIRELKKNITEKSEYQIF